MDYRVNRQEKNWGFSFFGGSAEKTEAPPPEIPDSSYPLAQVSVGKTVCLVGFLGREGMNRLLGMGLTPGVHLQVISSRPGGSVLVAIQDNRIGIGAGMAEKIMVQDVSWEGTIRTYLREMPIGTAGKVVGYEKAMRGYKGKLLSMGLTPGTEFTVVRVAPLGDPVEIKVRGFHLSLRKQEADALVVEEMGGQG